MSVDSIGIVTIDGPSLPVRRDHRRPLVSATGGRELHNNYQDPRRSLPPAARRGRQYAPYPDGTYFLNRWFATVELVPKTVVPIGHVGVVVLLQPRPAATSRASAFVRRTRDRSGCERLGAAA